MSTLVTKYSQISLFESKTSKKKKKNQTWFEKVNAANSSSEVTWWTTELRIGENISNARNIHTILHVQSERVFQS